MEILRVKTVRHAELYQTTGSNPSRFDCNNGKSYIVKDIRGGQRRRHLINEWLGASIASLAGIGVAPCAVVEIMPDSIPKDVAFPYMLPSGFGFGSEVLPDTKNINDIVFLHHHRHDYSLLRQFFSVILFDIWLYNNDRSIGNPNAMYKETGNNMQLIAIDHAALFEDYTYNTLTRTDVKNNAPTVEDTLLGLPYIEKLIRNNSLNATLLIEECSRNFEILPERAIAACISNIPPEFGVQSNDQRIILEYILHRQPLLRQWFNELFRSILQ